MTNRRLLCALAYFAAAFQLLAGSARATLVQHESLESIVRKSNLVVVARVAELQPSIKYGEIGFWRVKLDVLTTIKGTKPSTSIWVEGCDRRTTNSFSPGAAAFQVGEEVVVCLVNRDHSFEVAGASQGKFTVIRDIIEGSSISLEQFVQHVQEFLSGRRANLGIPKQEGARSNPYKEKSTLLSEIPCGGYGPYYWLNLIRCVDPWSTIWTRTNDNNIPPTIHINPAGALDRNGNPLSFSKIAGAIERAAQTWGNVSGSYVDFQVSWEPTTLLEGCDDFYVVRWKPMPPEIVCRTSALITEDAYGYELSSDFWLNSDLLWNADDPEFTTNCDPNSNPLEYDIEDIAAHEIGHFVGLAHVDDPEATMCPWIIQCEIKKRTLEEGDMEGARFLNREASGTIESDLTWCNKIPPIPGPIFQVMPDAQIHVIGTTTIAAGATLTIEDSTIVKVSPGVSLIVDGTLIIKPGVQIALGEDAGLSVSGTMIAAGTSSAHITFNSSSGSNWSGITLNEQSAATFSYCDILHAQAGINANTAIPTMDHTTVDFCGVGLSLFQSAGAITNSTFMHNSIVGLFIDGYGLSAAPLLTDNVISSNGTGCYITNSAPILERNTITDNAFFGIWCNMGGNPFISRNEPEAPGNNVLENNSGANLLAENYSFPFVGYTPIKWEGEVYGGYNTFGPASHQYDVWAYGASGVMGRKNYWSEYPPDEATSFREQGEYD
jgi:parallel beta-helix repeat protein